MTERSVRDLKDTSTRFYLLVSVLWAGYIEQSMSLTHCFKLFFVGETTTAHPFSKSGLNILLFQYVAKCKPRQLPSLQYVRDAAFILNYRYQLTAQHRRKDYNAHIFHIKQISCFKLHVWKTYKFFCSA